MPYPPESNIYTVKDVAKHLKISDASVYRLVNARRLRAFKVGGLLRFSKNDVDDYLNLNAVGPIEQL